MDQWRYRRPLTPTPFHCEFTWRWLTTLLHCKQPFKSLAVPYNYACADIVHVNKWYNESVEILIRVTALMYKLAVKPGTVLTKRFNNLTIMIEILGNYRFDKGYIIKIMPKGTNRIYTYISCTALACAESYSDRMVLSLEQNIYWSDWILYEKTLVKWAPHDSIVIV